MAAALGTTLVECPLCWHAIEVPLHADMGKRVGDHVEPTVTADAEPLRSHIATHDAARLMKQMAAIPARGTPEHEAWYLEQRALYETRPTHRAPEVEGATP